MRAGKGSSCWYFYGYRIDQVDNNWRTITQDHETLQIVAGYCLKFDITPPRRVPSRAELLSWSTDEVIDQVVSNMLACGAVVEVDPAESGFFSDIFTVDKVHRGEVYGKRVIISKYFTFPSENIFNEGLAHTHPGFPA